MDHPFISIAISTYNRSNRIYHLVQNILKYEGNEIEVVVLNNASTDDTVELLGLIDDSRFRLINYKQNVGGLLGTLNVLLEAKGDYVFVCLDKDFVDYNFIGIILKKLSYYKDKNVVFGKCVNNINISSDDVFYDNQSDIISNLVYIGEHPTGLFFRTKELVSLQIISDIRTIYLNFAFNSELIKAELSNLGNALQLNVPCFSTESSEDSANEVSKTYNSTNLFFHPNFRVIELNNYLTSLNSLKLKINLSSKLSLKIYSNILYASTFGYRIILLNSNICNHYSIKPVKLKFINLIGYNYLVTRNFLSQNYTKNKGIQFYFMLLFVQIKWFLKFIFLYVRN
jgi:glycosyltransferase involved in cell wall biosynthesis